jgi:hypothetical protein
VIRRLTFLAVAGVLAGSMAWAQEPRVEVSGSAGWTLSDGVSGNAITVPAVGTFNSIDPKDAFSWGARIGFYVNPNVQVGFLYSDQSTTLQISGTQTVDLGDVSARNYHGFFEYNFGDSDAQVRPYVLGGLGATQYGSVSLKVGDRSHAINGNSKFSTTWALGVKVFPSHGFGIHAEARWTPTYIKSDAAGWWCDPWWGCYVVGNAQYSNQFELSGGVNLRF